MAEEIDIKTVPKIKKEKRNNVAQEKPINPKAIAKKTAEQKIKELKPREKSLKGQKPKAQKVRKYYDYSLIFAILFLIVFGFIMIFSSSSYTAELKFHNSAYFVNRQVIFATFGFLLMIVLSFAPYQWWIKASKIIYVVSAFLSMIVIFVGIEANGARRWLGSKSIRFQPSELFKIGIIVFLAYYLVKYKDELHSDDRKVVERRLWIVFLHVIIPTAFITKENLSTGIIIFLIGFAMSFLATNEKRLYIGGLAFMMTLLIISKPVVKFVYNFFGINDYHIKRLLVWAEPEKFSRDGGYQVLQGLYAIGSGNVFGKGLGQGLQKFFLPESQNDMIFSIIVEEIGLFGAAIVLAVFAFIIFRLLIIAYSVTDLSAMYLVIGVIIHLSLQVILNIAVVTAVLPNTGVSLPFISYGGSSIVILLLEMSMVLSVARSIKLE